MTAAVLRVKALTKAEQKAKQAARRDKPDTMMLPGLVAEQKRMLAARDTSKLATPRITPAGKPYRGEPLIPSRPGSADALQVPSLADGQRVAYKPPAAYCVGHSKVYTGSST